MASDQALLLKIHRIKPLRFGQIRSKSVSSKQRDSSNKLGYKLVCAMFALTCINHASAANIFVDALPDQPGCDLAEAIIAANSNTAVGGCSAGAGEQDTIIFESFFDEYTISDVFSVNSDRGANAMPLITTKISVIGSSSKPMRLRPEGVNSRLFDVASNGDLSQSFVITKRNLVGPFLLTVVVL